MGARGGLKERRALGTALVRQPLAVVLTLWAVPWPWCMWCLCGCLAGLEKLLVSTALGLTLTLSPPCRCFFRAGLCSR